MDEQGLKVAEHQETSTKNRRKLAESTRGRVQCLIIRQAWKVHDWHGGSWLLQVTISCLICCEHPLLSSVMFRSRWVDNFAETAALGILSLRCRLPKSECSRAAEAVRGPPQVVSRGSRQPDQACQVCRECLPQPVPEAL